MVAGREYLTAGFNERSPPVEINLDDIDPVISLNEGLILDLKSLAEGALIIANAFFLV